MGGPHDRARVPATVRRLDVGLTGKSDGALHRLAEREHLSEAAAVNRALQLYEVLTEVWSKGGKVLVKEPGGDFQLLQMF